MKIITNNHKREPIDAWELTDEEREEFDYLDWNAIEKGEDSAQFIRYKGEVYDLGDLERMPTGHNLFPGWDAYISETFFSGILVKFIFEDGYDWVIMGRYYA